MLKEILTYRIKNNFMFMLEVLFHIMAVDLEKLVEAEQLI